MKGFEGGVYALGDFANIAGVDGESLPQLASVAQQAGNYCARAIASKISRVRRKLERKAFQQFSTKRILLYDADKPFRLHCVSRFVLRRPAGHRANSNQKRECSCW